MKHGKDFRASWPFQRHGSRMRRRRAYRAAPFRGSKPSRRLHGLFALRRKTVGFAGKRKEQEKYELELRLIAQASPCPLAGDPPGGTIPPGGNPPGGTIPPGGNPPPAQPAFPPILTDILERAQALFGPLREAAQAAPQPSSEVPVEAPPEPPYCPFPDFYPDAHWRKVPYPGARRCYLEGRAQSESGRSLLLHGIPGEYSPVPPVPGFKRFLRGRDGCGYWIRIRKM